MNLKKFPKASRTALVGLIILFLIHFAALFLPVIYTQIALSMRGGTQNFGYLSAMIGFIFSLIGAIGLGIVIYAVWVGRKEE